MKLVKEIKGALWVVPAVAMFCLWTVYPAFKGIMLSMFDASIRHQEFTGLKNWIYLFESEIFWKGLVNTVGYVVASVPVVTILALLIAIMAYRMSSRMQKFLRFAFYLPNLAAAVIIGIIWKWIFALRGLLNYLVSLFGIEPVLWLGTNPLAFWSVSLSGIFGSMGTAIIIYMAALSSIDKELYDSAKIDGCKEWQETLYISVPLMLPVIAFLTIIRTIGMFQIWQSIYIMTGGGPAHGTISIVYQIYNHGFVDGRFGLAAAEAVVLLVIILFFSAIQFLLFTRKKI